PGDRTAGTSDAERTSTPTGAAAPDPVSAWPACRHGAGPDPCPPAPWAGATPRPRSAATPAAWCAGYPGGNGQPRGATDAGGRPVAGVPATAAPPASVPAPASRRYPSASG